MAPERISTYGLVNTASDCGPCRNYAVLRSSELIHLMQVLLMMDGDETRKAQLMSLHLQFTGLLRESSALMR